nr:TPA_asm: hypothetical protein [Orchesella springtail adintovirus]
MANLVYIDNESIEQVLQEEILNPRHPGCPGFHINPCHKSVPIENIHYDALLKRPITKFCKHGVGVCQPFAEFGYLLLSAFARGYITRGQWEGLFPKRGCERFVGCPRFSSPFRDCCGYHVIMGRGNVNPDYNVPNTIRQRIDIDPTTLAPFTTGCNHTYCDDSAPYKFALFRAYASDLLLDFNFEIDLEQPHADPLYTIRNYGWAKALDSWRQLGALDWKQIILNERYHPTKRFSAVADGVLWDPMSCVKHFYQAEVMDESPPRRQIASTIRQQVETLDRLEPSHSNRGARVSDVRMWMSEFHDLPMIHMTRTPRGRSVSGTRTDMYLNVVLHQDATRIIEFILSCVNTNGSLDDVRRMRDTLDRGKRLLSLRGRRPRV